MKLTLTILLLIIISITTTDISAKPKVKAKITDNTVESLMEGLNSENLGLKSSSAYMIGELQLTKAVIPLTRILREDENEDLRITAALALYKIGTPLAISAVRQAIKFDSSKRVSKHCANFYYEFSRNKISDEEININAAKTALK